jgi:aspartyl-tRNA synthetase
MMSGYERYFQIARCFRDEDLRADRQPEFTQLDIEMGFVEEDDVIALTETVMHAVFQTGGLNAAAPPWPRLTYDEAMARFGSDRPDTRFGLELSDVSEHLRGSEFRVFESVIGGGGTVQALNAGPREMSRSELDSLNDVVRRHGGKAVAYAFVEGGGSWRSPIAKFFSADQQSAATSALAGSEGDLLLFVADQPRTAAEALGALRLELGRRFELIPADRHDVLWVTEFPMFEPSGDGTWGAVHHPFTAPSGSFDDPGAMKSRAYDLVVDGWELGGGSIRINTPEVQQQVFKVIGLGEEEADRRFGFLLDALKYGAPPHGGIAMGIDRIVALLGARESIREVIAFPKTASGGDPMTGAPAPVDDEQLRELGVRVVAPPPSQTSGQ